MALRLGGEDVGIQEKIEAIEYTPGASVPDTGDLEAGTNTITATTKPETPDYTSSLDLPAAPSEGTR